MNREELVLTETLRLYATVEPEVQGVAEKAKQRARGDRRKNVATVSAVLVTTAVIGVVWLLVPTPASEPPPPATPETDISQLTGRDVGEVLGLEPVSGPVVGCGALAEFTNGTGYCLEGVTNDPIEQMLLAMQITGRPRTPALQQWVVMLESQRHSGQVDLWRYRDVSGSLERQLSAEKLERATDPDSHVETTAPTLGPEATAEVGVTYSYVMNVECGIDRININGEMWQAMDQLGIDNLPTGWGDPQVGLLRLATPDSAVYTDELGHLIFYMRWPNAPAPNCTPE